MLSLKLATAKRGTGRFYSELLGNERLPAPDLVRLQDRRASDLAVFAFDSSAFYRDLYTSAGLSREDLRDPAAYTSLPVIDRTLVKDNADAILTDAVKDHGRSAMTGGSTGQPLQTFNDSRLSLIALSWRMYRWWGVEPSDNVAHIGRWPSTTKARVATTINWWPTRVTVLDAGRLEPRVIEGFLADLARHRPTLVEGYVGALQEIAVYARQHEIPLHTPAAIGATAAPLTDDGRRFLESAWGAPVHDQYRCSEIPWMAGECHQRDGLHVFADLRRIEVLDESGAPAALGETGEIVVSDLGNRVFPLLRYRLGDRGSLRTDPCPCGVTLPLMNSPDGRTVDMIRLPDGTVVAGGLFSIFSAVPDAVRQFQLHQAADHSITLRVVEGPSQKSREQVAGVAESLRARFGHQVDVTVQYVDAMPYTGGKTKYVTSDVPAPV